MDRFGILLCAMMFASSVGCTTCAHKAGYSSLNAAATADPASYTQRGKVYAILINGFDPLHVAHIERVARELNQSGYAKVYTGEFYHQAFLEKEIRRIHCEEPEARFVIVGYSIGAGVALSLTTRMLKENIPIDGFIEVAPVYVPLSWSGQDISRVGRHIIVGQNWQEKTYSRNHTEILLVPHTGHYEMPTHPATVGKILELLKQSTDVVSPSILETTTTYPLLDDPAPVPTLYGFR